MSVDLASLRIEVDATQADQGAAALDRLTAAGVRAEGAVGRLKGSNTEASASQRDAVQAHTAAAQALERLVGASSNYGRAQAEVARATRLVAGAQDVEATLLMRNAKLRGDLALQQARDAEAASQAQIAAAERAAAAQAQAAERAERAKTAALAKEEAAWARLDAKIEARNSRFQGDAALAGLKAEAAALATLEARIDAFRASIDPTYLAQKRLDAEMREATALYKLGAISASDYAAATSQLDQRMAMAARGQLTMNGLHVSGANSARLQGYEVANLASQFADVGVSLASGQKLWLVAIQQGSQIAGVFGAAANRGVSFKAALAGLYAAAAPILAILAPVAVAAGAAATAFGLLNYELSKGYPKDITDGLGLTEDQLDRVKHKTVTLGDTFQATLDVMGKYLTKGPVGDGMKWLEDRWKAFMDATAKAAFEGTATTVGFFIGAYRTIAGAWSFLPRVLGDVAILAANATLDGLQKLLTGATRGLNGLFDALRNLPQFSWLPRIPEADLTQFKGQVSGASTFVAKSFGVQIAQAQDEVRAGMRRIGEEISAGALKRAKDRALKEAGDAGGSSRGGKSGTEEVDAQTAAFIAFEKAMKEARKEAEAFARFKFKPVADIGLLIDARDADRSAEALGRYADQIDQISDHARSAAQGMAQAFGSVGGALGGVIDVLAAYDARLADVAARRAQAEAHYKSVLADTRSTEEDVRRAGLDYQNAQVMASRNAAQAQIQSYGDLASTAKGFFKEGSRGYRALEIAEQAYRAIQFAMSVRAVLMKGAETAATVAGAATEAGAVVTAETAKTGAALAGAAVRTPAKVAEGAASMFAALGPLGFAAVAAMVAVMAGLGFAGGGGSVPGAQDAENRQKSQGTGSVLGDASAKSDSIAKALDILAKNSYSDLQFSNQMLRSLRSIDSQIGTVASALARSLGVGGSLSTDGLGLGSSTAGPGTLTRILVPLANLLPGLFGSKTTRTLQDQGLSFTSQNLAQLLAGGVQGQTYQQVLENTKKSFFGITYSNKSSVSTTTGALDPDFARQVTQLIGSLRDTVLEGAKVLGVDGAQAALDAFTVDLGKLSFKDLKGDEIEAALKAVFSKLGDDLAAAAVPQLAELQKVGEGALETLARVVHDYTTLDASLASIGKTFGAVGVASLTAREHLVDLVGSIDDLVDQTNAFAENFLTDAERMAPVARAVSAELSRLGLSGITTKDQFKNLVLGLDLTTTAGQEMYASLLALAPAFAKVVDFNTQGSQAVQDARDALSKAYERESGALQDTIDKFDAFAQSLKKFRDQLYTGPAAQLSPEEQYKATKAAFEDTAAKARAGDTQAIGDLQAVSQAYLDASKDYYASSAGYFADLEAVRVAVTATQTYAQGQASAAQQQLDALNKQVEGLITINGSVLSVRDAILALQAAQAAQQTALTPTVTTPSTPPATNDNNPTTPSARAPDWASYLSHYSDVAAEYERNAASAKGKAYLKTLGISSATDFAQWHYSKYGQAEGRTPYAKGGIIDRPMTVGEAGIAGEAGSPEGIVPLVNGPRGLSVRAYGQDDTAALRAEVRGLRDQVSRLTSVIEQQGKAAIAQQAAIHAEAQAARGEIVETTDKVRKAVRPAA